MYSPFDSVEFLDSVSARDFGYCCEIRIYEFIQRHKLTNCTSFWPGDQANPLILWRLVARGTINVTVSHRMDCTVEHPLSIP